MKDTDIKKEDYFLYKSLISKSFYITVLALIRTSIIKQYSYDGVGNRLSSLEYSNWEYNQANQLLRFDNHYYQYDDNGNMIEMNEPDGYKHLTYSVDDRLVNFHYIDYFSYTLY